MISAEDLYFKESLYTRHEYKEEDLEELFNLIFFSGKLDNYCPMCGKESILTGIPQYVRSSDISNELLDTFRKFSAIEKNSFFRNRIIEVKFQCMREEKYLGNHKFSFFIKFQTNDYINHFLTKIGQYPSISDLNDHKTKKYKKVLSNEEFSELNKGIGLASHGIGIGSFVYFRRIFESLIFETYTKNKEVIDQKIENEKFMHFKMDKKIEVLKPFLDDFLYTNKSLYGIMSKGIHSLKEEECLNLYPKIELGIKLMLEERVVEFEKKERLKEFNSYNNKK